jgi:type II secretion system protein I
MAPEHRGCEAGFTLIEALVALAVVAMVVIGFLGIRTSAIVDATEARNWRLAREIAEERMSELAAGARETPAESGVRVPIERYEGFAYKIVIGEADVADVESETASNAVDNGSVAGERLDWQRNRDDYRRASSRGLSAAEYEDRIAEEDYQRRMSDKVPSDTEFEEVAVVVYFPRMNADYPGQEDTLLIKARLSTLSLSGLTPKRAEELATSRGLSPTSPWLDDAPPGGER